jgi:ADP-ribose pyrophosphatase YjhB (NUDIX family)
MSGTPRPTPPSGGKSTPVNPANRLTRVDETSAGGLILNLTDPDIPAALIARHDRRGRLIWSLPKGHIEAGETAEQAALREVHEETGITGNIVGPLGVITFWFIAEQRRIHKTVHHFLMTATGGELSDDDAEVDAVEWVPLADVNARLAYADERRLLERAYVLLDGLKVDGGPSVHNPRSTPELDAR